MNIKYVLLLLLCLTGCSPAFAADVELYILRHGETLFNSVHRAQGWSDTPLTQAGVEVAEKAGRALQPVRFIAAWSSDSGRARETAALILAAQEKKPPVQERKGLREVFFGSFEGDTNKAMQTAAALKGGYDSAAQMLAAFDSGRLTIVDVVNMIHAADPAGQAESYAQVAQRVTAAAEEIASQAQRQGGGSVLVVTHGMAIMTLLHELGDKTNTHSLDNASVTKIRYTDSGKFVIEAVNDLSYMQRGL
ncbi:histidine phosphatase family protein [Kalamiella sp. sgz302252]|uniref:histidine phosphatase family protein n=1 Tax=Pantoea sp. sgz302252 TaxID=3341827 RepID=UPI0036D267D0